MASGHVSTRLGSGGNGFSHDHLAMLLDVSRSLSASLELSAVLQSAIEGAVSLLGMDSGVVYLLRDGELFLSAGTPPLPAGMPDEHRRATLRDHPHLERCLLDRQPVVIADARLEEMSPRERLVVESADLRSAIFAPMAVEDRPLGAFIIHTVGRTCDFADADIDLCRTVSHQISLAVANAELFEEVQRSGHEVAAAYDATLRGWSLALEMRDHETGGHTERVTDLALRFARAMGLPDDQLVHVRRGALLHDIGKMVVPDAILHKPGPLTEEEWTLMRLHPEQAVQMLAGVAYLEPALDIPFSHHERWDGSGYPQGLAGDEIPLTARMFAIIDVYDALVSDRPYRPAWTREQAIAHIRDQAGRHFDPECVEVFLNDVLASADVA